MRRFEDMTLVEVNRVLDSYSKDKLRGMLMNILIEAKEEDAIKVVCREKITSDFLRKPFDI